MSVSSVLHLGTPPQDEAVIAPIREALRHRCNDPLLDLRWNAESHLVRHASYDAKGRPERPIYDGRWEVVRWNTANLNDRAFVVICTVTAPDLSGRYPVMRDHGDYTPIDTWLVDYMQLWDRAQGRAAAEAMKHLWAEHDRAEQIDEIHDHAAHQEALEKVYRTHGGAYWTGGAQGEAHPDTVRGLWPSKAAPAAPTAPTAPTPN